MDRDHGLFMPQEDFWTRAYAAFNMRSPYRAAWYEAGVPGGFWVRTHEGETRPGTPYEQEIHYLNGVAYRDEEARNGFI